MTTKDGRAAELPLRRPIYIFSRATLDLSLRDAAMQAGARFIPERATGFIPVGEAWAISTHRGQYEVSFLVGADGACSSVRAVTAGKYSAGDLSLALGFYLPGLYHRDTALALFQEPGFQGYLWSFPRVDHSSVGILRRLAFCQCPGSTTTRGRIHCAQLPGRGARHELLCGANPLFEPRESNAAKDLRPQLGAAWRRRGFCRRHYRRGNLFRAALG